MLKDLIDKKLEYADLFDVYSSLLTKKQQSALKLYFFDDLSYNEIGEILNISKQAAFDNIAKASKKLRDYEDKIAYLELKKENQRLKEEIEKYKLKKIK